MIAASQMPRVRDELVQLCSIPGFIGSLLAQHVLSGGDLDLPLPEAEFRNWPRTAAAYEKRLVNLARGATLFHVSAEMTAVADTARRSMPGYRLHPEDLPAERGLVMFDLPMGSFDPETADPASLSAYDQHLLATQGRHNLAPVNTVAAMWGPAVTRNKEPGVLVVTWSSMSDLVDWRERHERLSAAEARQLRSLGTLCYHDETVLPFGEMYDPFSGPDQPIRNEALGTLIATWLLMGQTIVTTEPAPISRPQRRALEREGKPLPLVKVVKLRQPKRPPRPAGDELGSTRTYRHRWIVEGHWRNQWYPSRNAHRPKYILSHFRGPDGAPLLLKPTVFDLRR